MGGDDEDQPDELHALTGIPYDSVWILLVEQGWELEDAAYLIERDRNGLVQRSSDGSGAVFRLTSACVRAAGVLNENGDIGGSLWGERGWRFLLQWGLYESRARLGQWPTPMAYDMSLFPNVDDPGDDPDG